MSAPCWTSEKGGEEAVLCECPVKNSTWIDFGLTGCARMMSSTPGEFDMRDIPGAEYALPACRSVYPN
eukprot:COSAG04_NODE_127_length_24502_cov_31.657583_6_plen_68_part_00